MAHDLFRAFDQDLRRLLLAGSGSAPADEGLTRAREGFAALAPKVPALGAVVTQIDRVLGARGRSAASELLSLGALNLRLRGAQARPIGGGDLEPLPPAAPLDSSTPQHDLEVIHRALTSGVTLHGKKIHRPRVIQDAVERGVFRDLRLLDLWVQALGDPTLGDLVATQILPELGEAAAARIERQFNPRGKSADARRLRCIVAIRGEAARPLVEACLKATEAPAEGEARKGRQKGGEREMSVEVRAAAVAALEKVAPGEAEARVCALYTSEKNQEVRAACVEVMGIGTRDSTLTLLLQALQEDSGKVTAVAIPSLQRFRHPDATRRLLALLTPEALDFKPFKAPRARAGQKLTRAQQQASQKEEQQALRSLAEKTERVGRVLQVLGARPSPEVIDRLIELFRRHPVEAIRQAAGSALQLSRDRRALEVLAERIDEEGHEIEALAVWAFFHLDLTTVFERMEPFLSDEALATKKGTSVARKLLQEISGAGYYLDHVEDEPEEEAPPAGPEAIPGLDAPPPDDDGEQDDQLYTRKLTRFPFRKDVRWGDVALRLLDHKELSPQAAQILGNLRDPRATAPLLAMLAERRHTGAAAQALQRINDRSILPALVALLSHKKLSPSVVHLLGVFRAREAVEPLCELLSHEHELSHLMYDALRRIGDPGAAVPIASALLHKGALSYPYQALRALHQLDNPAALPHLHEALKKAKKSKNAWVVRQIEELVAHLERDRKV
ncbi:MAG: hypothetical protein MUF64_12390 [Polyangiaceae bacterium]|jgi:HEAT repeat protein|nr:hypothetical protein [Polyangiaceae bacterium]